VVAGGLPYADGIRRIGATLAWIGGLPTERIIQVIPRLQVTAVLATTSFGNAASLRCLPQNLLIAAEVLHERGPVLVDPEGDTVADRLSVDWRF
jgi:phenylacetate-CoA ligase/benzoylacetate-CoA ligase